MYAGLLILTKIFITIFRNTSKLFCTNTGKIKRTEKSATMSEKGKLQLFFLPEEDKSLILGYDCGVVRGDGGCGGSGDDDRDDGKATYLPVYFYDNCMFVFGATALSVSGSPHSRGF